MYKYLFSIIIGIILFVYYNSINKFSIGGKLGNWYIAKYIGADGTDKYERIQYTNEDEFLARLRELRAFYLFGFNNRRNQLSVADIRLPRFISGDTRRSPHQNRIQWRDQTLDQKIG